MICIPCRKAGASAKEQLRNVDLNQPVKLTAIGHIIGLHQECIGCDCQHRIPRALNPVERKYYAALAEARGDDGSHSA